MKNRLSLLLLLFIVTACAEYEKAERPAKTLQLDIEVIHRKDGHYAINFKDDKRWKMTIAATENDMDWSEVIIIKKTENSYITEDAYDERKYFGLISDEDDTLILSNKLIKLEGAVNFRDIGGLTTKNGKRLKMGKLYRSDKLSELTSSDKEILRSLGIKKVSDLRTRTEVKEEPDVIGQKGDILYENIPVGNDSLMGGSEKEMIKKIKQFSPEESEAFMVKASADFATEFKESYKKLYAQISNDQVPFVYHCTAGKDRTGVATALLLHLLGVSKKDIYNDYLMSNYYRYQMNEEMLEKASIYGIDHKVLRPFMGVRTSYLDAAFSQIRSEYGSVENYFKDGLGFSDQDIKQWRAALLY